MPPVFDIDPDDAPWWAFFVILALGLGFTAIIGLTMWVIGDNPSRREVRLVLIPIIAGLTYAMKRLFGTPRDQPPGST